jgi:3-oxoacyl-[acyl-carrier-protein] synthase-3
MNHPTKPFRDVYLASAGYYLPPGKLTNPELVLRGCAPSEGWIIEKTGIRERRIAAKSQAMSDMIIPAACSAMHDALASPGDIDAVLVAGDMHDSGGVSLTSARVAEAIGIPNALCEDLRVGCPASVLGLHAGISAVGSGMASKVLVCAGEINTRTLNPCDKSSVFFGDGGAAFVLSAEPALAVFEVSFCAASGQNASILEVPAGGSREPITVEGLAAGRNLLRMDGHAVWEFGTTKFVEVASLLAQSAAVCLDEIDWFVPHQANLRLIENAATKLGIPLSKVVINLDRIGNTAGPSAMIAFAQFIKSGFVQAGHIAMILGFGGGLAWGGQIVRFLYPVSENAIKPDNSSV